jgi:hypothetical protein
MGLCLIQVKMLSDLNCIFCKIILLTGPMISIKDRRQSHLPKDQMLQQTSELELLFYSNQMLEESAAHNVID